MPQPPSYPPPPSPPSPPPAAPPPPPVYVPNHYVHQRRGPRPALVVALLALVAGGTFGVYHLLTPRLGPEDVYDRVEEALGASKCQLVERRRELHLLAGASRFDAFVQKASPGVADCIEGALSKLELHTRTPSYFLTMRVELETNDKGKLHIAPRPRSAQGMEVTWKPGVFGRSIDAERDEIESLLERIKPSAVECYLDASSRKQRAVPQLNWLAEEDIEVRLLLNPDGSVSGASVRRPASVASDWSSQPAFQGCMNDLLHGMPWPRHDGTTAERVNAVLSFHPVEL